MTKQDFIEKLDTDTLPAIMNRIRVRCIELINSGGIDLEPFEKDSYAAIRVVLVPAMKDVADVITPIHPDHRKMMKNLEHF